MEPDPLQDWLKQHARAEAWASAIYGLACFGLGLVALAITIAPIVFVAHSLGHPPITILISLGFVALLFLANARTRRPYVDASLTREKHLHPAARSSHQPVTLLAYPGFESANPLHYLLLAPRLTHIGWAHLRQALALYQLNLPETAVVLRTLLAAGKRLPIEQLIEHANLSHPVPLLLTLRTLPGIIILTQPPPGITLSTELRHELGELVGPLEPLPRLTTINERATAALQSIQNAIGIPTHKTSKPSHTEPKTLRLAPRQSAQPPPPTSQEKASPPNPADIWQQHRPRKH